MWDACAVYLVQSVLLSIPTDRGYCPGESIGVSAVINNNSKNEIIGLEIQLIQLTVFIASGGGYKN